MNMRFTTWVMMYTMSLGSRTKCIVIFSRFTHGHSPMYSTTNQIV